VVRETTALGAAYAAGLAVGVWDGLDELKQQWLAEQVFTPSWDESRRRDGYSGWQRAIEKAKDWELR
jgi:glycerol kinase